MTAPEKFDQSSERKFTNGDIVRVLRSSGEIEDGWRMFGYAEGDETCIVKKDDGNGGGLAKAYKNFRLNILEFVSSCRSTNED